MNATGNNKAAEEKKMIDITNMTDAQIAELLTTGMIDITNMTPAELERLLGVETRVATSDRETTNAALAADGLDGNGRFNSAASALSTAAAVLGDAGLELAEVVTADQTDGSEGRLTVELAAKTSNPFAPVPVANSVLVLSWFDLGNERFEVVAYLS